MRRWPVLFLMSCTPNSPVGQGGDAVDVHIAPVTGLRDLVAVAPAEAQLSWTSPRNAGRAGDRLPADQLWPGDSWTVTAWMPDGRVGQDHIEIQEPPGGNVLIVLLDDVGVDKVSAYGDPTSPATPTLDGLAGVGLRFTNAYAPPVCSPTRGLLLTGRHPRRTGMGWIADTGSKDYALPLAAWTLPEALQTARGMAPWVDATIGKWHLAGPGHPDVLTHPNDSGVSWFSGLVGNPQYAEGTGYDVWEHNENGVLTDRSGYLTTATVDDTLERIEAMPEPWMLYLPLNAAHGPWTPPPDALLPVPLPDEPTDLQAYDAVLQAMDTELGRLLDSLDPAVVDRTTIIVIGDNGTPDRAVAADKDPAAQKHTLYEGGVHVPLIVTGPHVATPGQTTAALASVADIFPTVAEIAGVPLVGSDDALQVEADAGPRLLDGRSWLPVLAEPTHPGSPTLYIEAFFPNGPGPDYGIDRRMVRGPRFKLTRNGDDEGLFELPGQPSDPDGPNLLEAPLTEDAEDAWLELTTLLDTLESSLSFEGY